MKIGIIGAGNLGTAIVDGLLDSGKFLPEDVFVSRRNVEDSVSFKCKGIEVTNDNSKVVSNSEIVIVAVQPKQLFCVLEEFSESMNKNHILVSVVTGVSIVQIQEKIGKEISVVRAMPNTAIAIKQSMTCIAHSGVSKNELKKVQDIFDTLGQTLVIEENLMAAATVLGACGIAFFMRFIRAASQGGIEVGFHAEEAQLIAAQTAKGAAALLLQNGTHPEQEIDKVTTPQGCTIAGLNEMEHNGLSSALIKGITASHKKIAHIM